jgi:tetratricopeptide (TPR) repeat protein
VDRLSRRAAIVMALALCLTRAAGAAIPPAAATPGGSLRAGVKELHRGLYERAEEMFRTAARETPGDPMPHLLTAFTYWWRILEDRANCAFDEPFLAASLAAIEAGERRILASPDDARALAMVGTARILRFHVEGLRKNYRLAAQEARSGKRSLEEALRREPGLQDAFFALGAYNYYADKIPALAKAARSLLGAPGGNAEIGLTQLHQASLSGSLFRTDARLLLALICGSREERCYRDAQAHLRKALEENPDSPLILASIGSLQVRLGYYDEAAHSFDLALKAAGGQGTERSKQRRALRVLQSEALAAGWHLEQAEGALAEAGRDPETLTPKERQVMTRVAREIAQKRGDTQTGHGHGAASTHDMEQAVRGALRLQREGRSSEAIATLRRAAVAHPDQPLPRFLAGRILYTEDRPVEADRELEAAANLAVDPPAWMEGWIELYRGLLQDRLGNRRTARAHYRRASEVKRFRSAERGLFEMLGELPPHARCAP